MKYPIGIQDFETLRKDGYLYIDKTAFIYRMVHTGRYYFLSRPRRFGKSLLLSTIEAYFQGKRNLFSGLAIDSLENEWTDYPVLRLDLNTGIYSSPESLILRLERTLDQWEEKYGGDPKVKEFYLRFERIVQVASEQCGRRVVILVDEYDKPLIQNFGNEQLQEELRGILRAFYSVLKTQDRYIKFALLTGFSKFGKLSVFSDLNNLEDISLNNDWATLCGITQEEIRSQLMPVVAEMAQRIGLQTEDVLDELKSMYDGYHFGYDSEGVYNPFSLLNSLKNQRFEDYWFETGTPSFLIELLKQTNYDLNRLNHEELTSDMLNLNSPVTVNPVPLLYQSGYLTIKGYDERFKMYKLGFPNKEVENGFVRYLLPYYVPGEGNRSEFFIRNFVSEIERGDVESFMERLQTMFSDISYQVMGEMELYFQNTMYVVFKMLGFYTDVEWTTHRGRIDIVIKTKDYIYVMEIKLDGSVEDALNQIEEKGYADPYRKDSRKLFKIGVNFSSSLRGIEKWRVAE